MHLRLRNRLCALFILLLLWPAATPVGAASRPPSPASNTGMDILGLGWQWSFPREEAWPRMSGSIRLDLLDSAFRQAAEAGVRWNRLAVWWCMVEPERGQWFWDDVDAAIQIGRNYGIHTMPMILYSPWWAVEGAPRAPECVKNYRKNYAPSNLADWDTFVTTAVRRYGPAGNNTVRYWEIWNEPDLPEFLSMTGDPGNGTVVVYAQLLRRASDIIRAQAPGSLVVLGGLSDIRGGQFLDQLLSLSGPLDVKPSFDIVSLHAYSYHDYKISLIRNALVKHGLGDRPLWDTELNNLGWSCDEAKAGLAALYEKIGQSGISRSFWYLAVTSHWGPGIFTSRWPEWDPIPFTPSPLYSAFRAQALPLPIPGKPAGLSPLASSNHATPTFRWSPAAPGAHPIVGYKFQLDAQLFRGAPLFVRPMVDAWVSGERPNYVPLIAVGPRVQGAEEGEAAASLARLAAEWQFAPGITLQPGAAYYWRVAAVDSQGNVGPYFDPARVFVRGSNQTHLPLIRR